MKTFMEKKENVDRKWYVIDAEGVTLGRLATKVATVLKGKHKPIYTPHVDCGDFVIVVNAEKVKLLCKPPARDRPRWRVFLQERHLYGIFPGTTRPAAFS